MISIDKITGLSQKENHYNRFSYIFKPRKNFKHLISLNIFPNDMDNVLRNHITAMVENRFLSEICRGIDYEWCGLSVIGFKSKDMAAKFLLFSD